MVGKKKDATLSQVRQAIKPYIKHHLFKGDTIAMRDIKSIAQSLLPYYKNVEIMGNAQKELKIAVNGLPRKEIIILRIVD